MSTMSSVQQKSPEDSGKASQYIWGRLIRDPRSGPGLAIVALVVLAALLGPVIAPHSITANVAPPFTPPGPGMPLGTDFMGQDVLSRVLHGGRTVVWMSVVSALLGVVVGGLVGMLAGYSRGWLDEVLMRCVDIGMAIPTLIFVLLFVSMFGRDYWMLVLLIGLSHAAPVSRVVRGVSLEIAEREFVEFAQALGASKLKITVTQILPNVMTTLMVELGLRIVWSVIILASLSLLGHGVAAPAADWGLMINENRSALTWQPWGVLVPLGLISLFSVGVNLLTEGIGRMVGRPTGGK